MKIVLDTNVLTNSFLKRSKNYWIWKALEAQQLTLCVTTDILLEYEEIIAQRYEDPLLATFVLDALQIMPNLIYVRKDIFFRLIPQDQDDEKFADCAIAVSADYLVTNDRHFNPLKKLPFPVLKIVNEDEFRTVFEDFYGIKV
jgi:uncharacterized protein